MTSKIYKYFWEWFSLEMENVEASKKGYCFYGWNARQPEINALVKLNENLHELHRNRINQIKKENKILKTALEQMDKYKKCTCLYGVPETEDNKIECNFCKKQEALMKTQGV